MTLTESQKKAFETLDNHDTAFRSKEGELYSKLTKLAVDLIAANREMKNLIVLNEHAKSVDPSTKADYVEYAKSFLILAIVFAYMKNESLASNFLKLSSAQHFTIRLLRNSVAHEGLLIPTNERTVRRIENLEIYSGFAIPNNDLFPMARQLSENEIIKFKNKNPKKDVSKLHNRLSEREEAFKAYTSQFGCGKTTFVTPLLYDIYSTIEIQTKRFLLTAHSELQDEVRAIRIKEDWRTVEDFLDRLDDLDPGKFPIETK